MPPSPCLQIFQKNTLLPKELPWRLSDSSNVLQVILAGRAGMEQISKKISTDALGIKCHCVLKAAELALLHLHGSTEPQG